MPERCTNAHAFILALAIRLTNTVIPRVPLPVRGNFDGLVSEKVRIPVICRRICILLDGFQPKENGGLPNIFNIIRKPASVKPESSASVSSDTFPDQLDCAVGGYSSWGDNSPSEHDPRTQYRRAFRRRLYGTNHIAR